MCYIIGKGLTFRKGIRVMSKYRRTTKDVVCRKCGHKSRVFVEAKLTVVVCGRPIKNGSFCGGSLKLRK